VGIRKVCKIPLLPWLVDTQVNYRNEIGGLIKMERVPGWYE